MKAKRTWSESQGRPGYMECSGKSSGGERELGRLFLPRMGAEFCLSPSV